MELAYLDKLAQNKSGVRYLLAREHLFERTVDAKKIKTKKSKEKFVHFLL